MAAGAGGRSGGLGASGRRVTMEMGGEARGETKARDEAVRVGAATPHRTRGWRRSRRNMPR